MRDYSRITDILVSIEENFPVDKLIYKGLHVWPLIRGKIAYDCFWDIEGNIDKDFRRYEAAKLREKGNGNWLSALSRKVVIRFVSMLQNMVIAGVKRKLVSDYDILFLTIGFEYAFLHGKYYNKFYDPLKEIMDSLNYSYIDLETGFENNTYEPKHTETLNIRWSICLLSLITRLRLKFDAKSEIEYFHELLEYLRESNLAFDLDYENFTSRVEYIIDTVKLFEAVTDVIKPRLCFVVCYYQDITMALTVACKRMKIKTVEIQHSIINKDDWNWARWMRVPDGGYKLIPDYLWTWGREYADMLACWVEKPWSNLFPVIGGNPWIMQWKEAGGSFFSDLPEFLTGEERTILYTVPFGDKKLIDEWFPDTLIRAIEQSPKSWRWVVRLHYKSDRQLFDFVRKHLDMYGDKVAVHHAAEYQLFDVFKIIDYHISQTCSTVAEAEAFDVPIIIISEIGRAWFSEDIERGYYFYAEDSHELLNIIMQRRRPVKRISDLIVTDRDKAKAILVDLLGSKINFPLEQSR